MRSWAKVLVAFPVDWGRVDQKVLFAVTALGGLFALTVAVWMVVGFAQYVPVHVDDARIQADAFSAISTNGSSIFRDGLPFMEVATYVVWVKIFGWGSLIAVPIVSSIALAVLTGYIAYRVTESPWAGLAALLLLASLPLFLERARLLPFYPATMFFGYAGDFRSILLCERRALADTYHWHRGTFRGSILFQFRALVSAPYPFSI